MLTTLEKARILEMLQRIPVFGGVSESSLMQILESARPVEVRQGDYFFRENDRAMSMFVLVDGSVEVRKSIDGIEYELARLEPGDCFGELELIDFCSRAASVQAVGDCRAIELTVASLHAVYKVDPTSFTMLQMNMGREVSRRLRRLETELPRLRFGPEHGPPDGTIASPAACDASTSSSCRCVVCAKHVGQHEEHLELWHADVKHLACCPVCAALFREHPERYGAG
ncbi:cyclic nucleotide-binding domain-containing protein [Haloferula sargassicola]|uniref:Cyclic nucleotide-binding domain-containing protein n=1 Tax=Haloferula sargassicola TaxID=490096 RepID=A0ABP9URH8_9BACT